MISSNQRGNRSLIGVFIIILLCTAGFLIWNAFSRLRDNTYASEGVLTLTELNSRNAAPMDGEWHFTWNEFHNSKTIPQDKGIFMSLPRIWNGFSYNGEDLSSKGYGTYQLKVVLGNGYQARDMAIYIPFIHSSYDLYIQDRLIASDGKVGKNRQEYTPSARTLIAPFE